MTNGTRRGWGVSVTPQQLFTPGKTQYPLYRRLGGPQGRSGQVRKTRIRSLDHPAHNWSLYWLSYPAHMLNKLCTLYRTLTSCGSQKRNRIATVVRFSQLCLKLTKGETGQVGGYLWAVLCGEHFWVPVGASHYFQPMPWQVTVYLLICQSIRGAGVCSNSCHHPLFRTTVSGG